MSDRIYKVLAAIDWQEALAKGRYVGSQDDRRDGFIHFSTGEQLAGTLAKHFAGKRNQVLVAVDTARLGETLKWEPSRGGQMFPHLYGDLDPALAVSVLALKDGPDGPLPPGEEGP